MSTRSTRGFTLVELLVTLAILATVTTFAVASYRQYIVRSNRVDATTALLRLTAAQEKFYLQNGQYADGGQLALPLPAGLGMDGTERGFYQLAVTNPDGNPAIGYDATATVDSGGPQRDDEDCWTFSVNEIGVRGAETSGGDDDQEVVDRCWR